MLFTLLSVFNISKSGAEWDDVIYTSFTLNILGKPAIPVFSYQMIFGIFPTDFHLTSHCFAMPAYMIFPFFIIFGMNIISIKIFGLTLTVISIYLMFRIIDYFFGYKKALITIALLCISPQFIHYSKTVLCHAEFIINFFFYSAVFLATLYLRKHNIKYLYAATFCIGLAFSTKLSIVARILGLLTAALMIYPRQLIHHFKASSLKKTAMILLFLALGSILFIYYNAASSGKSLKLIKYNKISTAGIYYGNFSGKLKLRFQQLKDLITERIYGVSKTYDILFNEDKNNLGQSLLWFYFCFSFIFNLFYIIFIERDHAERK